MKKKKFWTLFSSFAPTSVVEPEPVVFGRSRSRCEGLAPGSGSTLDKTEEILNDILSIRFNIDYLKENELFLVRNMVC